MTTKQETVEQAIRAELNRQYTDETGWELCVSCSADSRTIAIEGDLDPEALAAAIVKALEE